MAGVELGDGAARIVSLDRFRRTPSRCLELEWDALHPAELVAVLRGELGATDRVALTVGLGFLHLKPVKLPPAPLVERRRILALEPDRFFPVQDTRLAVSLADETNFAFAMNGELLERWVAAFEEWAPVVNVETSPQSVARALGRTVSGMFEMAAAPGETGMVELQSGHVRTARRAPALESQSIQALPSLPGVPAAYLAAFGAARGVDSAPVEMLLTDAVARRIARRSIVRVSLAAAACALSLLFAVGAVDRMRERRLEGIRTELAALTAQAQPALALQDELNAIDHEARVIEQITNQRPDPLRVLAALTERLPRDAVVLGVKATGDDWQIDGTAADAAAIVPLLDGDDRFEGVRFLSASSRFREGNRTYETFSIAFRVRPRT